MGIPRRTGQSWSRWEGTSKLLTKNCCACEWYRKIDEAELCGWGAAFKYLVETDNPRHCELPGKEQEYIPSAKYLDTLVEERQS